jgi:hypothetical protein
MLTIAQLDKKLGSQLHNCDDRAIAQAFSRWLATAAFRIRAWVWSSGICGGQSGAGAALSENFGFSCESSFHQILHLHNHLGQVQEARSGRRAEWTQFGLHPIMRIKQNKIM